MGDIDVAAAKSAFEAASWWAEMSTVAVTFGVFIEFLALFIFSKEMPPPEKKVMIFATFLIVAGCAGEFIFGSRASDSAATLQRASDQKTATALDSANRAAKEAENEKLERIKLEATIAPRRISSDDCRAIIEYLRIYPERKVEVKSYALDVESAVLGSQILNCLPSAGIAPINNLLSVSPIGGLNLGMWITGPDQNLVGALREALVKAGHQIIVPEGIKWVEGASISVGSPSTVTPDATVFVGPKPIMP